MKLWYVQPPTKASSCLSPRAALPAQLLPLACGSSSPVQVFEGSHSLHGLQCHVSASITPAAVNGAPSRRQQQQPQCGRHIPVQQCGLPRRIADHVASAHMGAQAVFNMVHSVLWH